ncbi:FAD-binding oxidoreductase [Mesorhizobium sp. CO1-1-11]|uniref:NAD(P)/FAD-dependent oxidoreductase n=1 Tax=Mesorhizobium sp. CO1-1-11 TaxID=2876636 RepID=UPI001CC8EE2A|nr:FAD-binding oxidoreductase [Mesorhizobium sp. CO1-1-11]MBZ9725888.1 FAD-binding oxidoreductase [Mesorhizobium sp. CO1-1-11]
MTTQATAAEIVIVGGGIYGTSLAYELARAGKTVTLLEADDIAAGASGGSGERGVRANSRDLRELPMATVGFPLWAQYQRQFEGGVGYRRTGGLHLFNIPHGAHEHEVRGSMEAMAMVQNALGVPSQLLDRAETLEREPELSGDLIGSVYCPDDGVCDHTFATQAFARQAHKAGATLRTRAHVAEILHINGRATGVRLASEEVVPVGEKLVLLANKGVLQLLRPVLQSHEIMPITTQMPQMMFVTNPNGKKINHLLGHAHRKLSVKQIPDGTVMLSGGQSVAHTPDGRWKGSLSSIGLGLADAIATLPFIDESSFLKVDASRVETCAVDGIPIVDTPAALKNTIYGFAWTGHGFAIALGLAKYLAEWILSGDKPDALEIFCRKRFHGSFSSP